MKKFVIKISLNLLIVLIGFYLLDYVITQGLKKSNHGDYAEWNDIFEGRINTDILISGSSIAWRQISPKIIEDNTKCSAYNLGMDGHNFYLQYYRYLNFEKYNKKPKVIIQTLWKGTMEKRPDLYNYEQFLPYLDESLISEAVYTYKGFDRWDKIVPMYKYMGEFDLIKVGVLEYFNLKNFSNNKYKGYASNDENWDGRELENIRKLGKKLDINNNAKTMQMFESFLKYTKSQNIKLILVYTPIYIEGQLLIEKNEEMKRYHKLLAEKHGITFLDYSNTYLSQEKKYFHNTTHLNKVGSEIFTKMLIKDIASVYRISECAKD